MLIIPLPARRRRDDRSLRNLCPGWKPPSPQPPVPVPLQVSEVRAGPEGACQAIWIFNQPINNPTASVGGFYAAQPGRYWTRVAENTLVIEYDTNVESGTLWSVTAGAGGVTSIDGEPLQAGSGIIVD